MELQQDPDPPDNRYLHVDMFSCNATDSFMCKQDEITLKNSASNPQQQQNTITMVI